MSFISPVCHLFPGVSETTNWSVLIAPREGHDKTEKSLPELLFFLPKLKSFVLYAKANAYKGQDRSYERVK